MKRMKRMMVITTVLVLALFGLAACGSSDKNDSSSSSSSGAGSEAPGNTSSAEPSQAASGSPEAASIKGKVQVWGNGTQESLQGVIDDFNKAYPDIAVEYITVETGDVVKKLQTLMVSGGEMPDVVWLEVGLRGRMMDLDIWEDLSKEPYNVDKGSILDSMIPLFTNKKGELIGPEVSVPLAGLAYKRDMAKQYLGTDDPAQLEAMLGNWDAFIAKGQEVQQASGGKVFMMAGVQDAGTILKSQRKVNFVSDDDSKLQLEESLTPMLSRLIEMKEKKIVDSLEEWSPAWNASFAEKKHIFYPAATWGPQFVIKPNDKNGEGNWGLMLAPDGGYLNGGTIVAIPKESKNKEAAFAYVKWSYLSEEGAVSHRDKLGYFSSLKSIYDNPDFYSSTDSFFGGQDIMKKFSQDIAKNMASTQPVSKYDNDINSAISLGVKVINSSKSSPSVDKLIADIKKDIGDKIPELK